MKYFWYLLWRWILLVLVCVIHHFLSLFKRLAQKLKLPQSYHVLSQIDIIKTILLLIVHYFVNGSPNYPMSVLGSFPRS